MPVELNARPMVLNFDDLTPTLGQRRIRQVSPVGSDSAAGSVIARERLTFQWIQWASQAGESLADGGAWPELSSRAAFGGRNSSRVSTLTGGRVCQRELVALPVASGDGARKVGIRKWKCLSVNSVDSVPFRGISRVREVILASFSIGLVFANLASLASSTNLASKEAGVRY
jgi:hypothetical protein